MADENATLGETEVKPFGFTELPPGAERITEDEYERLPDYVQDLINASADGALAETTPEELTAISAEYFENSVTPVEVQNAETQTQVEENTESNECDRGHSAGAGGALHSPE
jgi:hypothetical protein